MSDQQTESSEERAAARDATNWAKDVSRLNVGEVPEGAINLNVQGKRLASPIQGFGKMWQKTYQVRMPTDRATPTEVIATWRQRFPEFWPEGNHFYGSLTGIEPGDVAVLNMTMPGKMKLSTVVQAQVLMRASDPIFEMGLTLGGHKQEDRFWDATLTNLAAAFGHEGDVDTQVVCVDKKRQWSTWRNVWHSSAIRSTIYMLGAPGRGLKRVFRRDKAVV